MADSIEDVEVPNQSSYNTPLLDQPTRKWKPLRGLLIFSGVILVLCISVALIFNNYNYRSVDDDAQNLTKLETEESIIPEIVAFEESDSDREYRLLNDPGALSPSSYKWTNKMLSSQRTGYHFRPHKYWQSG
ncbi:hypothetical protein FRX31_028425 [Thalictrum thalictroides]|uniref:Uncharacterized protein n=1 Tax=Thalictrum thalictroides TaxID=46969 RepID=A0A7J6VBB4_THATH|nr:hypothetical protein FRX31_028425 [Thalictrum thalictroides]